MKPTAKNQQTETQPKPEPIHYEKPGGWMADITLLPGRAEVKFTFPDGGVYETTLTPAKKGGKYGTNRK
jgi:hypothetical protein